MKKYEKPVLVETDIMIEGVYAGSGEEEIDDPFSSASKCPKNGHGNNGKVNGSCKRYPCFDRRTGTCMYKY